MRRALVLIGVSRTGGNLEELKSIENSFQQMRAWAEEQRFDPQQIYEISDLGGKPVRLSEIAELIQTLDDSPTPPDQLVIYFNGHGVRNGSNDLWLLSKAPNQRKEAVSIYACLPGAFNRYFKHVVLISDACRVRSDDNQFASVEGDTIFQNAIEEGESNYVDIFFASTVGTPALEVNIDNKPTSIYTLQLSEFLRGSDSSILELERAPDALPKVLRGQALKAALSKAVRARLKRNGINRNVRPDAIVTSDPIRWLSTFNADPPPFPNVIEPLGKSEPIPPPEDLQTIIPPRPEGGKIPEVPHPPSARFQQLLNAALSVSPTAAPAVGPQSWIPEGFHFETSCGFHLTGAHASQAKLTREGSISVDGDLIRVVTAFPQLALITLDDQTGVLLPVIPDHIGFIRFTEGVIEDVAYEPSANYGADYARQEARYARFSPNKGIIRGVREVLASAVWTGNLLIAAVSDEQIARIVGIAKYGEEDVDPMLLVLLGYACVTSGKQKWLPELSNLCIERLKFLPFDLKLLTELSPYRRRVTTEETLPPFPLVGLGWTLLSRTSGLFREQTTLLRDEVTASPWTELTQTGVAICKRYVHEEEKGEKAVAAAAS